MEVVIYRKKQDRSGGDYPRTDNVGKVFIRLADGGGYQCLTCDRVFDRKGAVEHANTVVCYPTDVHIVN
jgi:hypothetical protein